MPYKIVDGEVSLEGPIAEWANEFQRWYQADMGPTPLTDFVSYLGIMVNEYAALAKGKWMNEPLNKGKAAKLDTFLSRDENGNIKVAMFDMLEYLANNLMDSTRNEWSSHCRREVKQVLISMANEQR